MKFTINGKELKALMDKAATIIEKRSLNPIFTNLHFTAKDGILKAYVSDSEQNVKFDINTASVFGSGSAALNIDDFKLLNKMTDMVTVVVEPEEKIPTMRVKCGKKVVSVKNYVYSEEELTGANLSDMVFSEEKPVIKVSEKWLLETVENLYPFTLVNDSLPKPVLKAFHINTQGKRIEACDSHRLFVRKISEEQLLTGENNILLYNKCLKPFKKILNKKSESQVTIYDCDKFVKVEGSDFTYIVRKIDGQYLKTDPILTEDTSGGFSFTANKEVILDIMKYDEEIAKMSTKELVNKIPVVLHKEDNKLYSAIFGEKAVAVDEIETENLIMSDDLYIGFNPKFIMDTLNVIDADEPKFAGTTELHGMFIYGKEYTAYILPVRVNIDVQRHIIDEISKSKAA